MTSLVLALEVGHDSSAVAAAEAAGFTLATFAADTTAPGIEAGTRAAFAAPTTSRIGLAPTLHVTTTEPFHVATQRPDPARVARPAPPPQPVRSERLMTTCDPHAQVHLGVLYTGVGPQLIWSDPHAKPHVETDTFVDLLPHVVPSALTDIVDKLLPALQERGAYSTAYEGSTLREHLALPSVVGQEHQVAS